MYTDDKSAQIVLALLKKYNIKKIVVSPGMCNVPIAGSVLCDDFFEAYSVVDERSAAYFACGLAHESGEPVVISCTGATASRNYLPALTEAYYRNLPVIALTSQHGCIDSGDFVPQVTNRTVSQEDVKRISVFLPRVRDHGDILKCELLVNKALTLATIKGGGPVHINLLSSTLIFDTKVLPEVKKIDYYSAETLTQNNFYDELKDRRIGIFIGSHRKFSSYEKKAIENFIDAYNAAVFYDHTSNYHGKNKLLISVAGCRGHLNRIPVSPEIIIDIGSVTGDYGSHLIYQNIEAWRVSEDGVYHQRNRNLRKQFECSEEYFFSTLAKQSKTKSTHQYYTILKNEFGTINIPELPLSNTLISAHMAKNLPPGSSLHLGILNSLRNMNFFELDDSIDVSCNVGGFGIDGAVSTLVGQSMANKKKLYFGQIGDLAFFYDMNAIGLRHISNNLRLLLVNNGLGVEFRTNSIIENQFADRLDILIAAGGHYGSAKAWSESMGFQYMSASSKDEFLVNIVDFCSPAISRFEKPVLFEIFTTVQDEQNGLKLLREANTIRTIKDSAKDIVKKVLSQKTIDTIKRIINY